MSKLIFDKSQPGRKRHDVADFGGIATTSPYAPEGIRRTAPIPLPELAEVDTVRHYIGLSRKNFGVDTGFYPLGSCTMKYNPKVNEEVCMQPEWACIHPEQPGTTAQGALALQFEMQRDLAEISGMERVSLQPAAGAHGELTGMLIFRAYFNDLGEKRTIMIVPDSSHGTNPASAVIAGFTVRELKSNEHGQVSLESVQELCRKEGESNIGGIMMTNPNTVGVFEPQVKEIAEYMHSIGALLYYDGANLNANMGYVRPGDMGFDLVHFNLHKTFSTPHGGGGPGSGPVGVCCKLAPYLPHPLVAKTGNAYEFVKPEKSIGRMKLYFGNFGVIVRAMVYMKALGREGLKRVAENAVLNANYIQERLKGAYDIPYYQRCMHEFVLSADRQKKLGASAMDIAKKLLNDGYHAPTVYFPLIVHEAMMIEPTETESLETLDAFCDSMLGYAKAIEEDVEKFKELPNLEIQHLDDVAAARNPVVRWTPE